MGYIPAPSKRLLNLTGFFSNLGGATTATDILRLLLLKEALTKGCRPLRRKEAVRRD